MTDIRAWLETLGLGRYADAFEANHVDWDLLPDLTEADLQSLGVASAGHRVRLRAAIENAEHDDTTAAPALDRPSPERRHITIMFCDLVGSTELTKRMDPEELRALMQAYQSAAAGAVARYDGHVAQYLGDGLLSYFGWPHAHEDDAERAVRAGLDIIGAVKSVDAPSTLQVRIGIASGPVVVGETGEGQGAASDLAVGETPNLAARIQSLARPDQVVVSGAARKLLGNAFELFDLGTHRLKGVGLPLQAWRVDGVAQTEGRFEAHHGMAAVPMVGRDAEVALFLQRWEQVKAGEGQVVLLGGEPGIGKSRIVRELRARLSDDAPLWLHHQCSPFHTGSAFYPIVTQIERAAGFRRDDDDAAKRAKLEAMLAAQPADAGRHAPLLAALLSIPPGDRYPPVSLSPGLQKEKTIEALIDLFTNLAVEQPVLAVFEDAHWMDPSTLDALGEVIARIETLPVLVVVTHRPEFAPPWPAVGHIAAQSLTRLSRRARADMVDQLTGGKPLPAEVSDQIIDKTDGIPLFVEELTKAVLEAGFLHEANGAYRLVGPLPALAIPPTLQDSLMARLDRLGPMKEIAQIGACIGRVFSHDLLSAVAPLRDEALDRALEALIDSELVFRRGTGADTAYVFKHALVQDAAHGSLLRSRRQQLHAAIAQAAETGLAARDESGPEFLARHYSEAGLVEEALPHWLVAGQEALNKANIDEALRHFAAGVGYIGKLPPGPDRAAIELRFQTSMGYARIQQKGYAAPEARTAFERAEALLPDSGAGSPVLPVMVGIGLYHWVRGDMPGAVGTFERMRAIADATGDPEHDMLACTHLGSAYVNVGRLTEASGLLKHALTLFDEQPSERQAAQRQIYGQDIGVGLRTWLASGHAGAGLFDRAGQYAVDGVARARTLDHPFSLIMGLASAAQAASLAGDSAHAIEWADEAIALHRAQRFPFWGAWGLVARGVSLRRIGEPKEALANLNEALGLVTVVGGTGGLAYLFAELALAEIDVRRTELAAGLLAQADSALEQSKEEVWRAPIAHAQGLLALAKRPADKDAAARHFERALAVAQGQDARTFALRSACALARLWADQGDRRKAHDLLRPLLDGFTEGADAPDVTDAAALRDALA